MSRQAQGAPVETDVGTGTTQLSPVSVHPTVTGSETVVQIISPCVSATLQVCSPFALLYRFFMIICHTTEGPDEIS